ncbi:Vasohibin-domain-containing protein [Chytridium lagenaria]|nr:Vasohibin-domain-containing protein [Chytridium lagenaria]
MQKLNTAVETVLVAIYFSNGVLGMKRFAISFKSEFHGTVYRHIVLGLKINNLYGSLGLSRRADLMFKPPSFMTLHDLIVDFKTSYERNGHSLSKIKMGLAMPHERNGSKRLPWKVRAFYF